MLKTNNMNILYIHVVYMYAYIGEKFARETAFLCMQVHVQVRAASKPRRETDSVWSKP